MPYPTLADLPDAVKALPKHGQEIYQKAFNAAFEQYKDRDNREALAHARLGLPLRNLMKRKMAGG